MKNAEGIRRPAGEPVRLPIAKVRRDGGTQMRGTTPQDVIAQYAEDMQAGNEFPPIWAFFDGTDYWCADGHIRIATAESVGHTEVDAIIEMGTQRDAILAACGVNREHGAHRTREDERRAVTRLLTDPEWGQWSDREIAKRCGVSDRTVNRARTSICDIVADSSVRKVTRNGKTFTQNTSGIGKKPDPPASTVVVITEREPERPDVLDEIEEGPDQEDPSENPFYEDWIATRDSYLAKCPAYRKLAGYSKVKFEDEARDYHRTIQCVRPVIEKDPEGLIARFFTSSVEWATSNGGPTTWVDCPDCKDARGLSSGWHGDYDRHCHRFCDTCDRKGFITGRESPLKDHAASPSPTYQASTLYRNISRDRHA